MSRKKAQNAQEIRRKPLGFLRFFVANYYPCLCFITAKFIDIPRPLC